MLWFISLLVFTSVHASPLQEVHHVRMCVTESLASACSDMSKETPISCIVAPDIVSCLEEVKENRADLTNVDPSALFLAEKFFDLEPITYELINGEPFRYEGIALVKKGSGIQSPADLRNRTSCHTGLGRTVGWQIPLGRLTSSRLMAQECGQSELSAMQNFFTASCVPGQWSSDPVVEKALKTKYPRLCSQCKNPATCAKDDDYAGYEGVMKCLADGAADVAFTKIPALKEYLNKNPDFENEAEILCFEGGRKSVRDPEPCIWGVRPTNVFVTRREDQEDSDRLTGILLQIQSQFSGVEPSWYRVTLLAHPDASELQPVRPQQKQDFNYLGDFLHAVRRPRYGCLGKKAETVALCVTSDKERHKCEQWSMAAESRGLWPVVACVEATTKAACMQLLKEDNAQILVLDGGDVYKAAKYFDLQPIASELYGDSDATYYSVAVLRSASDVTHLSDLRGLRSCHTGIGRTAGWVMPVGALLSEGLLAPSDVENCNLAAAVSDFFAGGSCVPGANDTKYNKDRVRSGLLCKHCVGDDQGLHKCSRDSRERYSGYAGAFRCLAEGKGDVAFVKHLTVPDYTDGHSELHWTRDLLSSDFMLLCSDGGTAPVTDYLRCNLGRVPSHQVVTNKVISEDMKLQLTNLLADSSKLFGKDSSFFRLFGKGAEPDLIFKDSATGLRVASPGQNYEQILGREFVQASIAADSKTC